MLYFRRMFLVRRGVLSEQSVSVCLITFLWRKRRECNIHLFLPIMVSGVWCQRVTHFRPSLHCMTLCVSFSPWNTRLYCSQVMGVSVKFEPQEKQDHERFSTNTAKFCLGIFVTRRRKQSPLLSAFDFCWGCPFSFIHDVIQESKLRIEGWHEWEREMGTCSIWSDPYHTICHRSPSCMFVSDFGPGQRVHPLNEG